MEESKKENDKKKRKNGKKRRAQHSTVYSPVSSAISQTLL